jgi:hypothetical protein
LEAPITAQHEQPDSFIVPILWADVDDKPVLTVNQLLSQIDVANGVADTVLLTFGHAAPPPVLGDDMREQLANYPAVLSHAVVRVSVGRARLQEFVNVLNETLEKMDRFEGGSGQ